MRIPRFFHGVSSIVSGLVSHRRCGGVDRYTYFYPKTRASLKRGKFFHCASKRKLSLAPAIDQTRKVR
jgi:hypothetical protein